MTKILKNGVHEDANPINTHHNNPEEKQCTKFFAESDIVSRLTPHCKATKKRNRGALKGKGGGEKTIDRTEKHRPQPKKQTKILNKNVTRDITKSSQIPPDRRTFTLNSNAFFLSKMRRRKIRRSQRSKGESGKQKKNGKNGKKTYSSALVELDFQFVETSENVDVKKSS
jgi:hypothetical protein